MPSYSSSTSEQDPGKTTDNINEKNDDTVDQDSEMPKEATENVDQVEEVQERGDDHQEAKEQNVQQGNDDDHQEEELEEDMEAENVDSTPSRKRARESSSDEAPEQGNTPEQGNNHEMPQEEEAQELPDYNADHNSPVSPQEPISEFCVGESSGYGRSSYLTDNVIEQVFGDEVEEEEGKGDEREMEEEAEQADDATYQVGGDKIIDEETLSSWVENSGGDEYYDNEDPRDMAILRAMIVYRVNNQYMPLNDELKKFLKPLFEIAEDELEIKYLIFEAKFHSIVAARGEDHEFERPYCREMFNLSKKIWGTGLY